MIKITKVEDPDTISWEEVKDVLYQAHAENRAKGIVLPYPHLPAEEIKEKIYGRGGRLFVALDNNRIVGTGAIATIDKDIWCGSGKYAYFSFASVLPEYSGQGVFKEIVIAREKYALEKGLDRIYFDTHEGNTHRIDIALKNGYKLVDYRMRKDHNSVVMVKWLKQCPFTDEEIRRRYKKIYSSARQTIVKRKIKASIRRILSSVIHPCRKS